MRDWRGCDLLCVHTYDVVSHRPSIHKRVAIYNRHCSCIALVDVSDVGHFVDRHVVINVRNLGHVHAGVSDVHILNITWARTVPRHVDFSRSERKPSHTYAESATSNEGNKSWRIDRPDRDWSRHPAPAASDKGPPTIVEGSKTPRFVFYPGPAPR